MKFNCSVTVSNRILPNLNMKSAQKYKNAVLAVMKPPTENTIYLLLITQKNKSGARYKIRGNIEKIFSLFRNEGKTTIRFKNPPHDLCISGDKIQLRNFMLLIKKVWISEEKNVPEINKLTIPQAKSSSSNKLEIKMKSQYPFLEGFSSELQILNISSCHLKRVDNRILKLKNLTTLCLDRNNLIDIPVDLKKLSIKNLSLSHNKLGKNMRCWNFLSWPLSDSLEYLDLSGNEMKYFPSSLVRFNKLKVLKLSNISVNQIPFRLCLLRNLQELDLSKNQLLGLPGTITRRNRKFDKLDVSDNQSQSGMDNIVPHVTRAPTNYVPSLLEYSIQNTIDSRLPYNEMTLPQHLVLLLDLAKLCLCGKSCARDFGLIFTETDPKLIANTFISSDHSFTVPILYQACCPQHFYLNK